MGIARARVAGLVVLAMVVGMAAHLWGDVAVAQMMGLVPTRVGTVSQSRCGSPELSTAGTQCLGFDAREARSQPDIFIVGFENNQDPQEKHVLQTVAEFDLRPLLEAPEGTKLAKASLTYAEASTTRRSASGDQQYGVLPTCNTKLGVADGWDGNADVLLKPKPAAIAGVTGATTGDAGAWDVTPQVTQWLEAGEKQGVFVMSGDDESMDVNGQSACLSYVINPALEVEFAAAD